MPKQRVPSIAGVYQCLDLLVMSKREAKLLADLLPHPLEHFGGFTQYSFDDPDVFTAVMNLLANNAPKLKHISMRVTCALLCQSSPALEQVLVICSGLEKVQLSIC